ncbi:hypothetical protein P4123_30515 [Pseudomonas aeruginosa]|nr:hypothetical protein [Pseudomonas aeruginosa]
MGSLRLRCSSARPEEPTSRPDHYLEVDYDLSDAQMPPSCTAN